MPKDSVVINGFNGGLNVDSSTSDLVSDGRGKDQLAEMEQVYTDQIGKVVAKHPKITEGVPTGLTSAPGPDYDGTDTLIHDGKLYQHNGLYKMGDEVVWSGATNYQAATPTAGAYNPVVALSNNSGNGLDVKFEPKTDGIVIFQGENSTLGESITGHILFDEAGQSINDDHIRFSIDGDSDGRSGESSINPMDTWIHTNTHSIGVTASDQSIHASLSGGSIDTFTWKDMTASSDEPALLRFRVGRQPYDDSSWGTPYSENGAFGVNLPTIYNRDLVLELKCEDLVKLDKLVIYLDTDYDDHIIYYNYTSKDSWMKSYEITPTELSALSNDAGGTGAATGFVQVVIPYNAEIHEGSNYRGDQYIRTVGVVPVWDIGTTSSLSLQDPRFELRYLGFADAASSTWMNRMFQFKQSSTSNKVESLLRPYSSDTGFLINADYKITIPKPNASGDSGKLYYKEIFRDETTEIGSNFLLLEYDYDKGVKAANSEDFVEWNSSNEFSAVFSLAPISSTYALESGYPDGTTEVNATWKTAATIGRQVYIGCVTQPPGGTEDASLILKSAIGKPAGFSDKTYIDIEVGGDSITVLESSGDRLFVFTNNQLSIINVAQDIEFLEAELPNYGIASKNQVCKVGEGIAFINDTGVYYFNGQNFQELKGTAISTAVFTDNKAILYDEVRKLLWCYADTDTVYYYSFKTNTWVGKDSSVTQFPQTNGSNFTDGKLAFYSTDSNSSIPVEGYYYSDGSNVITTNRAFSFKTGRIDCGDPSRTKRFYSIYIQAKAAVSVGVTSMYMSYSLDGGITYSSNRQFLSNGLSQFKVEDLSSESATEKQGKTGKNIVLKVEGKHASTEIDDITIVFRNKVLK